MNRRTFLCGLTLGALSLPRVTEAQQAGKPVKIGVLTPQSRESSGRVWESFRRGLHDLGWDEGRNIVIEARFADGKFERLDAFAQELLTLNVSLIVAANSPGTRAAIAATKTVPVVMVEVGDPLSTGFVTNLARPGGNVTGVSNMARDLTQKRLELLREAAPTAARIAVIMDPDDPIVPPQWREAETAARRLGVRLVASPVVWKEEKWRILSVDAVQDQPAAWQGGHRDDARALELEPVSISALIHQHVRIAIETAVHEELRAALWTIPYERSDVRRGYRNGTKTRTLTGPTGPVALTLPRARLFAGAKEWTSRIVPRYQRRMPEVNEAVVATYLAGSNTRRIRGALQPLLKAAPLSKSAVSRVIATLKDGLEAWRTHSLADLDVVYVYLDGFALRVRTAGKVVSVPVLGVVGVLTDGRKHLLALELCAGESLAAWKGCLDDLVARGLRAPVLAIIDGNAGLRRAVGEIWPRAAVQRCCVHKLRNVERKAPKHAFAEIRDDFHRIVYAASADAARAAYATFERVWGKRCPGVARSLKEGGDELLTFFRFPIAQWKALRTTNTIERLHEEFRRRVKTQGSLPTEDAALVLLFSLVASGQVKLRRIDGWKRITAVVRQSTAVAA